ncbi:hypothetical protein [Pasteuria penetrans]|uniref:hypothetical protein n=1 Tax=Pasteuria penetrans TaxID=86005 RepID=UPI000F988405|nr:hypothetical protein [Pasteuria penetrans]
MLRSDSEGTWRSHGSQGVTNLLPSPDHWRLGWYPLLPYIVDVNAILMRESVRMIENH